MNVYIFHVTYAFQSESTLCISRNVKELIARKRRNIWSLSDCNGTRTQNHLVQKRTLNHLPKLTKWFSWIFTTSLYGVFHWLFLLCHVRVSQWLYTLYLSESQRTPCSKQTWYLNFKWLQREWNPQPLTFYTNTKPLSQTDLTIELNCEYLSVRCIWLSVHMMPRTRFRDNIHSVLAWMSKNSLLETVAVSEAQVTATGLEPTTT